MVSAVTPYVSWLGAAAAQAEEAASQARAAAAAFEAVFSMTVPPPVVAANRVLLAALTATNFFGQNTRRSRRPRLNTWKCGPKTRRPCTATPDRQLSPRS